MRHAAAAIALTLSVAGCGGSGDKDGTLRTTAAGTQVIEATDSKTGLHFEVSTSPPKYGGGSAAYVSVTKATPDRVRRDLEGEQLALSCKLRGAKVRYFPNVWEDVDKQFGTALLVDGDASAAELVTYCMLMRGEPGPRSGTTAFSNEPSDAYSLARLR